MGYRSDHVWFIDTGYLDPGDRDDAELDKRDHRAAERDEARDEACSRHYPKPNPMCPACGAS